MNITKKYINNVKNIHIVYKYITMCIASHPYINVGGITPILGMTKHKDKGSSVHTARA